MNSVPAPARSSTPGATCPSDSVPNSTCSAPSPRSVLEISVTNGRGARGLASWMKRANASRPVPVSPTSSTGESLVAICARSARSCCMTRLRPTGTPGDAASNLPAWRLRLPASRARSTVRSSFCSDSGFSTKSKAPRRVASTAVSTVP